MRWVNILGGLVLLACSSSDGGAKFATRLRSDGGVAGGTCELAGTWATFVEIGVGWQSGQIKPGAGVVRQWILGHRTPGPGGAVDASVACGIGARGVPLGSPWFSIIDIPQLGILNEWTGVEFAPALFDSGRLATVDVRLSVQAASPDHLTLGDTFTTLITPFSFGVDGLPPDQWPDVATMRPLMVDHDGDGRPGLTGSPFTGPVEGEAPGVDFQDPRVDLNQPPARAGALFMAIRNRAALAGKLVSCDPPRFEGTAEPSSLLIETRNVGCTVAGTGADCTDAQGNFIDANLPQFKANGTSRIVSVKVADDANCADVRAIAF